mmetsp:Transcript_24784/g.73585  ORF Transcript_24784/g.73585 Transcript_24784/m.73585 type:complete len:461 (+) Transcript_24784:208-1590(+)
MPSSPPRAARSLGLLGEGQRGGEAVDGGDGLAYARRDGHDFADDCLAARRRLRVLPLERRALRRHAAERLLHPALRRDQRLKLKAQLRLLLLQAQYLERTAQRQLGGRRARAHRALRRRLPDVARLPGAAANERPAHARRQDARQREPRHLHAARAGDLRARALHPPDPPPVRLHLVRPPDVPRLPRRVRDHVGYGGAVVGRHEPRVRRVHGGAARGAARAARAVDGAPLRGLFARPGGRDARRLRGASGRGVGGGDGQPVRDERDSELRGGRVQVDDRPEAAQAQGDRAAPGREVARGAAAAAAARDHKGARGGARVRAPAGPHTRALVDRPARGHASRRADRLHPRLHRPLVGLPRARAAAVNLGLPRHPCVDAASRRVRLHARARGAVRAAAAKGPVEGRGAGAAGWLLARLPRRLLDGVPPGGGGAAGRACAAGWTGARGRGIPGAHGRLRLAGRR